MCMGPLLNASQFAKFMSVIKRLGARVEEEHSKQLGELKRLEESSNGHNGGTAQNGAIDFESLVRGGGGLWAEENRVSFCGVRRSERRVDTDARGAPGGNAFNLISCHGPHAKLQPDRLHSGASPVVQFVVLERVAVVARRTHRPARVLQRESLRRAATATAIEPNRLVPGSPFASSAGPRAANGRPWLVRSDPAVAERLRVAGVTAPEPVDERGGAHVVRADVGWIQHRSTKLRPLAPRAISATVLLAPAVVLATGATLVFAAAPASATATASPDATVAATSAAAAESRRLERCPAAGLPGRGRAPADYCAEETGGADGFRELGRFGSFELGQVDVECRWMDGSEQIGERTRELCPVGRVS